MKRLCSFFLILFIVLLSSFASSIMMVDMSSPIYDYIEDLYVMEGKASPMGAKPWSEIDVVHMMDRIDPISDAGKELKRIILDSLHIVDEKDTKFVFSADFNPNFMVHLNKDGFQSGKRVPAARALDSKPFDLGLGFAYDSNIALFMNISLGTYPSDLYKMEVPLGGSSSSVNEINPSCLDRMGSVFVSNIPIVSGGLDIMNFPERAYFTAGYDAFRLYIGRDRAEWGNGVMGNVLLGDTLPYHDMLSLTFTGSKWFGYQMLVDFYTPFENFGKGDRDPMKGIRFMLGHRFEFTFLSGQLVFSISDSIMYHSADSYLDPRLLNPMSFLHNGFIAGNSNSLAVAELEYAPIKNLSIYAQFGMDDLAIIGEPAPPADGSTANALAALLGIRFYAPMKKGYLHGNFEAVYTMPTMYHRAAGNGEVADYNMYFISSNRYKADEVRGLVRYLSFPFGSDAIAAVLKTGYKVPGVFDVTGSVFFMAHGIMDEFSKVTFYKSGEDTTVQHTPSTSNPFDSTENGSVEYTLAFGVDGEYSITDWCSATGGLYFINCWNLDNKNGYDSMDLQLSLGMKISY